MAKLLAFNVPTTGHVNPTLPVIRELTSRGHTVTYYLTEPYRKAVEAAGGEFCPYDSGIPAARIPPDYFERRDLDGSRPADTARNLAATALDVLPDLLKIVEAEQPDAIFHDSMCPWGWMVARVAGLSNVSSTTLLSFDPLMMIRTSGLFPILRLGFASFPYLRQFTQKAKEIERAYPVITMPDFIRFMDMRGTLTISYTSSMFQPQADRLAPDVKFVGPSIEPRPRDSDFPWDALDGRPLIYISLGTVINQNAAFYRSSFDAFKDTSAQVVMSVGKATDIAALGSIPPNFIVRNYIPQLEILQKATAFVTHGGMNSIHEALYYNVPLIVVPQSPEQRVVAKRVKELGAGMHLNNATPSASDLARAAQFVMNDPKYRECAALVGESLRSAGGPTRAADEIEHLIRAL